ncbi:hypothetical protein DQ226_13955 [Dietzia maris]|uniref:Uncharacterized protein n=2 Tax=Dietzia TaxID=37914 RepID=A0A365P8E3_9ACTN|nr:hypothetical protein H483_0117775 [Dietzia sp. UCD-THP]RBA32487.1 hypothetical protein DQ226_13955 [Dietzia maris]
MLDATAARESLIVGARAADTSVSEIAKAAELTTGRVYNLLRQSTADAADEPDRGYLDVIHSMTRYMHEEQAAANALARERNEVARRLVDAGATARFLAGVLGENVDTLRNWLYP